MDTPSNQRAPQSQYKLPESGFVSYLPMSWVPYAELARIDRPMACLYLYFPCLFGTLLAGSTHQPTIPAISLLKVNLIFLFGSFLVRSAGCSWNDIVDQEHDRKVSRTRLRPIARKAISTSDALFFTTFQVVMGLCLVFLLLPTQCLYYSVPSMLLTGLYPYGKRFTHYPQLILGGIFNWGIIMAFPAFETDLLSSTKAMTAAGCLYLSCIAWTLSYDTIYAAQDTQDDIKAGIKSPVVRHQRDTPKLLMGAASTQILLLSCVGITLEAALPYFVVAVLGPTLSLYAMISRVDLDNPEDCLWWFKNGSLYTGAMIGSGFGAEYVVRAYRW